MNNRILIIGLFLATAKILDAQTIYLTENEIDIYWQPTTQIEFSDYHSTNKDDCLKYYEKYRLSMSSSIDFRGVEDIPKKRGKYDKFLLHRFFAKIVLVFFLKIL